MANLAVPGSAISARPGNLPAEVTRFIGRRRELAETRQLLERSRLVTLTGVGGVGKTRLALRLAADVRRSFTDGVWLVELSAIRDPKLVPRAVADALGLEDRSADDVVDLLADHLAGRRLLLILDTCEHLLDACALLSDVLLRAAPCLRIVATSRQSLELTGEHTFQLSPLDAPDPGSPAGPDVTIGAESIELFTDRAAAIVHGFALTADNRRDVARLCHRLDGIPLAIELAVVRLRVMPLAQLVDRLDDRFRLLGTSRSGQRRHQTLRAAVGWSHELCTDEERLLWARLSVFPHDFRLDAAEMVCADERLPADTVFEVLAQLVEKSIVQCDRDAGRYRMLDTIREYGTEQLDHLGESQTLHRRHRDAYVAGVGQAVQRWRGDRQLGLFAELQREHQNLRVALEYSLSTPGEERIGLRMITDLDFYWIEYGLLGEGRGWIRRALDLLPDPTPERGEGLLLAAHIAILHGDSEATGSYLAEAAHIAQTSGDPKLQAHTHYMNARFTLVTQDLPYGLIEGKKAVDLYAAKGYEDPYALSSLHQLAVIHALSDNFEQAIALCDEGIQICESRGESWCRSLGLWTRAIAHWFSSNVDAAMADITPCLRLKEALGDRFGMALAIDVFAACTNAQGHPEEAALLFGATDAMWRNMRGLTAGPFYTDFRDSAVEATQQALGEQRFESTCHRGSDLTMAQALAMTRGSSTPPEAATPSPDPLTRREREIAGLVAEGLSNREIAERLVIAKRTADSHVEHILTKLGFTSRTQIAVWISRS